MQSCLSNILKDGSIEVVCLKDWLDWASGKGDRRVMLPMLQRGSVWKPSQIIALWDSLLRNMPTGAMMVSSPSTGEMIDLASRESKEIDPENSISLIDGQQRTVAMLIGWMSRSDICENQGKRGTVFSQRLWVDFAAKEPLDEHLYRYRFTTLNQPFGTSPYSPDSRLSLPDKRTALSQFSYLFYQDASNKNFEQAMPFSNQPSACVPVDVLVKFANDPKDHIIEYLNSCADKFERCLDNKRKKGDEIAEKAIRGHIEAMRNIAKNPDRIEDFMSRLKPIFAQKIPLIYLDKQLFSRSIIATQETNHLSQDDNPLVILFHRIGRNFTKLSEGDYIFAVLKNMNSAFHGYVECLLNQGNGHIAALLTPTDLAVSAVRLAAAEIDQKTSREFSDQVVPKTATFHNMLRNKSFVEKLDELVKGGGRIKGWFEAIQRVVSYDKNHNNIGLPVQLYPHFGTPLVQTLLRLAQKGCLEKMNPMDVVRLVLFWIVCVYDAPKASLIAFKVIKENDSPNIFMEIYSELINEEAKCAYRFESPNDLKSVEGLVCAIVKDKQNFRMTGTERFIPKDSDPENHKRFREFYRRWWQPWTHRHPILLWLQRDYIKNNFEEKLVFAGQDEDISYDYDHILPSAEWSNWTGSGVPHVFPKKDYWAIGNALGNLRIWDACDNRKDGATTPKVKLELDNHYQSSELLRNSAISADHAVLWSYASSTPGKERSWDEDRAFAFEKAVEKRTFALYESLWGVLKLDCANAD